MVAEEAADATAEEGEAYVARVVAAALAPPLLGHRLIEGGLSMPLPVYGGPNPDYIMRHCPVSTDGRYRLRRPAQRIGTGRGRALQLRAQWRSAGDWLYCL